VNVTPAAVLAGPLPPGVDPGPRTGCFVVSALPSQRVVEVEITVATARPGGTDYLLERFGATADGPLGRPRVQPLPEPLRDGVSIVAFAAGEDGALRARIDLVRRAWGLDVALTVVDVDLGDVDALVAAMLELLLVIRPEPGEEQP
jgi:hypothetical protein